MHPSNCLLPLSPPLCVPLYLHKSLYSGDVASGGNLYFQKVACPNCFSRLSSPTCSGWKGKCGQPDPKALCTIRDTV